MPTTKPQLPIAALVLGALAGCGTPRIEVLLLDEREVRSFDEVVEACAWWGIDCEEAEGSEQRRGVLTVFMIETCFWSEDGTMICGENFTKDPCEPTFVTNPFNVTHEMGHAFGLEHRQKPANVMHKYSLYRGDESTPWQDSRVLSRARHLASCL